jgi:UDP-N-acetylmuramoylalanine--D-glutamate ligase
MSKRIAILGAGESGTGAAILARNQGFEAFVSDMGTIKPKYRDELQSLHIDFEEGQHTAKNILSADEVIKSPGIPEKVDIIRQIRKQGIPVISEIEFAARYTDAKIIAITGSNGKSTTTSLVYHILSKAGKKVALAGNIGKSFARLVAEKKYEFFALEVSSFQLDDIAGFKPFISILLNITPDHLDRYDYKFEHYIASKFKVVKNQTAKDYFIYNLDDANITENIKTYSSQANMIPFSIEKPLEIGAWESDNYLNINFKKKQFIMSINELALQGKHNVYNSMAAGIAARILEIRSEKVRESLSDFKGLEHRLEKVATIGGVEYINDSKATNVNSTWYALEVMEKPVVWIVGGVDKGNDYIVLQGLVSSKVKAIICLGIENTAIHKHFSKLVDIVVNTQSMQDAVRMAHHLADKDDVVLLSPCCASFDLFDDYEDRGNQFKSVVREL